MKSRSKRVVLFASISEAQHEALRYIAFKERRSIADVTREALEDYIERKSSEYPLAVPEPTVTEKVKVATS